MQPKLAQDGPTGFTEAKTRFVSAARTGQLDIVKYYLDKGITPDILVNDVTAFQMAATTGDIAIMELLAAAGANVNFVSRAKPGPSYSRTALNHAAANAPPEAVTWLLEHGANPIIPCVNGMTASHLLAERVNGRGVHDHTYTWDFVHQCLARMLDMGLSPQSMTEQGTTLLHRYAQKGAPATLINLLIDRGADLEARNSAGATPLHCAVANGKADTAKALIERGANVEAIAFDGARPLHICADLKTMEVLLAEHPSLEAQDLVGRTALFRLLESAPTDEAPPTLSPLLDAGASLDTPEFSGATPRDRMASGRLKAVKALISAKQARASMRGVIANTKIHRP